MARPWWTPGSGSVRTLRLTRSSVNCPRPDRPLPDPARNPSQGADPEMTVTAQAELTSDQLQTLDGYWRAANYLSVGQIYLMSNPLLTQPLRPEHIKPRLLGHWGTTPGLNFIYAHLNRAIRMRDLDMIYVCGPGHGGPGMVANTYLEGSYSEIYPAITEDFEGLRKLFR